MRNELLTRINSRIEKYFDFFHIDEIQDFGGYDFDILMSFAETNLNLQWVGDFYQHTFDTSRDGNRNRNLHDNFEDYKSKFTNAGLNIDGDALSKSWRCSPSIAEFITTKLGIEIESHKEIDSDVIFCEVSNQIDSVMKDNSTIKLFYQNHRKYKCYSNNWGKLKGANDLDDVCVVLNKNSYKLFEEGKLSELAPLNKNRLYVACSRAHGNLFFIPEDKIADYKM